MEYNFIAIEGTIGAGKTSLARKVAEDYNGKLILEQFEENSFLPKFYKDPDKFAFPLEMSFMASRFQQLKDDLYKRDLFKNFVVADYFLDKSLIFARKTLPEDEYKLFSRFFNFINTGFYKPDLIVYLYLEVDRLKENIMKRGRSYENDISKDYLARIQEGYLEYFKVNRNLRVVIVDTNNLDFVSYPNDYAKMTRILESDFPTGISRISP